jgi:hypothetical protein
MKSTKLLKQKLNYMWAVPVLSSSKHRALANYAQQKLLHCAACWRETCKSNDFVCLWLPGFDGLKSFCHQGAFAASFGPVED